MTDAGPVPPRGSGPAFFWRRGVIIACALLALLLAVLLFSTWLIQRYATFPRPPDSAWNPARAPPTRRAGVAERRWQASRAWFLPPWRGAGRAPLLIYSHGNAELIDMRAGEFAPLRAAALVCCRSTYPGYGRSQGSPSEESLAAALVAAYDWAAGDAASTHGASTRSASSTGPLAGWRRHRATRGTPSAGALVLESTFENFDEVVSGYGVPRWLLINHFDTRAVLRRYPGPVLLLHGTGDRVFASEHALAPAASRAAPPSTWNLADTMIVHGSGSWCSDSERERRM